MNKHLRIYIASVCAAATLLLVASFVGGSAPPPEFQWTNVLWFAAIALIAERMSVTFRVVPGHQSRSSLAFLPFLSALALFPARAGASVIVLVCLISHFSFHRFDRTHLWRGPFNASQGALAALGAGAVYTSLSSVLPTETFVVQLSIFYAMALTFFVSNMLLSSVALALLRHASVKDVFVQIIGPGAANLTYDLLASSIALVPVVLYQDSPVTGLGVILLPLFLIRHSYLSKQDLIAANNDLLRALVKAIETRDPYTSGHSHRVAALAKAIAVDMGLHAWKFAKVDMAALLHDIGKIDPVFAVVLSKPHELTAEERELIQTHAARGADMLESMKSVPQDVVAAVRHHHERFDGRGYPDGLCGHDIPLMARIIMLCDSIDAMLSDRPYRRALPLDRVRAEIAACAGSQFDPGIVKVVLEKNTLERAAELIAQDSAAEAQLTALAS